MKWLWLALAGLFAVAAGATWFAFHDPNFVAGLTAVAVAAAWKAIAPKLKPKNFTADQLERIRRGENPFHDRGKQ